MNSEDETEANLVFLPRRHPRRRSGAAPLVDGDRDEGSCRRARSAPSVVSRTATRREAVKDRILKRLRRYQMPSRSTRGDNGLTSHGKK
jgi:hypothetical protein